MDPVFSGYNHMTGANHVSRQSSQALSGNSVSPYLGRAIGGLGFSNTVGQQGYQALTTYAQVLLAGHTPRPEPLKTDGIKLGELTGWRGWRITPNGFLRSMSADVVWAPGEPMEGKTKSTTEGNGIYAFKTARDFLSALEGAGLDIYGKVALWGDVIEHEIGYRAQFAKVISLEYFLGKSNGHHIKDLRERYCPQGMAA